MKTKRIYKKSKREKTDDKTLSMKPGMIGVPEEEILSEEVKPVDIQETFSRAMNISVLKSENKFVCECAIDSNTLADEILSARIANAVSSVVSLLAEMSEVDSKPILKTTEFVIKGKDFIALKNAARKGLIDNPFV